MADFLKDPTNGLWIAILILFVTFYGPRVIKKMPEPMVELLNKNWFRAFIIFVAVYLAQHNIKISLVIAVIFLLVNHGLQTNQLYESFLGQYGDIKENFSDCLTSYKGIPCTDCVTSGSGLKSGQVIAGQIVVPALAEDSKDVSEFLSKTGTQIDAGCRTSTACHQSTPSKLNPSQCVAGCTAEVKDQIEVLKNIGGDGNQIQAKISSQKTASTAAWNRLMGCSPYVSSSTSSADSELEAEARQKLSLSLKQNGSVCDQILHDRKNWVFKSTSPSKVSATQKGLYCNPNSNVTTLPNMSCVDSGKVSSKKAVTFQNSHDIPPFVINQNVGVDSMYNSTGASVPILLKGANVFGCQDSMIGPYGQMNPIQPAKKFNYQNYQPENKQCMHSGQCCGYQGDDTTQLSNNICLKLEPDLDHGYCVKMPSGTGSAQLQKDVLSQLNQQDKKMINQGTIDSIKYDDNNVLYKYDPKTVSNIHLSPHFPIHKPGVEGENWCHGGGGKCTLDWDSTMFNGGSSNGTGPGASYPQNVITDGDTSYKTMGTGCWTYGGDAPTKLTQNLGHTHGISVVDETRNQNSKPYHGSPFDDLRDTSKSGGRQKDTFVGYAPPVGNCAVYSKPDLDFTGTATYPLNDTNALKNLRGETASREPMYAGELH